MSKREPGQLAYETWVPDAYPWENTPHKARWAAVEAAIRADERAKVIEECANRVEDYDSWCGPWGQYNNANTASVAAREIAADLRALEDVMGVRQNQRKI